MGSFRRIARVLLWGLIRWPLALLLGSMGGAAGLVIDPRKVAIYIRWSTDDQSGGTTLDVQRDACLHQARAWQFGIVPDDRIFIDDGYSGGTLERPAMKRLRRLVQQGEVTCVIVYRIDRLSRNIVDATQLVLREWDGICHLRCVQEPIDTTSELGRMIFSILAMFADFERSAIRGRLFTGRVRRAQEGRNPGSRLPHGYTRGDTAGSVVVDEAAAAVVRRIFSDYCAGRGPGTMARRLNEEGVPSPLGGTWSASTIQRLLRNQAYAGRRIWGCSTGNKRYGKTAGEKPRIKLDTPLVATTGAYPLIIDPSLFEQAQHILQQRSDAMSSVRTGGRALASVHLLTGLARCRCGHLVHAASSHGKPVYRCTARREKGSIYCQCSDLKQPELDALVVEHVRRLADPDMRGEVRRRLAARAGQATASLDIQVAEAEAAHKALDVEETRIRRDYRSGTLTAQSYEETRREITEERERAAARLHQLRMDVVQAEHRNKAHDRLEAHLDELTHWDTWDAVRRKRQLRDLVAGLTIYRAGGVKNAPYEIELRYRMLDEPVDAE